MSPDYFYDMLSHILNMGYEPTNQPTKKHLASRSNFVEISFETTCPQSSVFAWARLCRLKSGVRGEGTKITKFLGGFFPNYTNAPSTPIPNHWAGYYWQEPLQLPQVC